MMQASKRVALVTGANQGIGLEIARQLAKHGLTVLIGARDQAKGEAAAKEIGADAHAIQLDVTDQASIDAAPAFIARKFGRLDVLVNNAGISQAAGRPPQDYATAGRFGSTSLDDVRAVFETNVFGVIAVTQAMLPLLREAPAGRIVNMSSTTGSLTWSTKSHRKMFGSYAASKTALNAITFGFAADLETTRIKVNAVCPGFTKTNMTNYDGTGSVDDAAREPVRLALLGPDGPTGTFSDKNGTIPW